MQFWSPYLRKDVVALEAVQRRFTRLIPKMRGLSYEEIFKSLGLYSLEFRRMEVYMMIKGMDKVEQMLPLVGHSRTRGHSLRIRCRKFKTELRRNYLFHRCTTLWKSLPQTVVDAGTVSKLKEEIDRFLIGNGLKGYGEKTGKWG